jgi:hypothetical protein
MGAVAAAVAGRSVDGGPPGWARPPGPGVSLLWVSAATAAELGERMRNADTALKPGR